MDIAILGAGVGGVTTAIALTQRGYKVSIYERHAGPATIGAGIVVWPNASFVLDQLGLLPAIAALGGSPRRMRRISEGGEDLGQLDITALDRAMGHPSYAILRRDLQAVLLDGLSKLGVDVVYDHCATMVEPAADGRAAVKFDNGLCITPDLIIGADGRMKSAARRYVYGDNAPVYQGFVNWIGVLESNTDVVGEIAVQDVWGVGKRFGVVPVTRRKLYWAGGMAQDTVEPAQDRSHKQELSELFAGWPDPIATIIADTPEAAINRIAVHDHDPIKVWHRDNVILLGDAAHAPLPTSGQGACQAMEDAWHLVRCLDAEPGDLSGVFRAFTARRYEKTTAITLAARNFAAALFNRDGAFCRARNERSRLTDYAAAVRGMAQGWGQGLPIRA